MVDITNFGLSEHLSLLNILVIIQSFFCKHEPQYVRYQNLTTTGTCSCDDL